MPDLYLAVVVPLKMQETAGGESAEEVQLSTNLKTTNKNSIKLCASCLP